MAKGTVLVNLRRNWFAPNGSRYDREDNPHSFPAAWADEPSKEQKEANPKQKFAVLPSSAEVLEGGGRTVMTERLTANGTPLLDVQAVDDDVKSVGNTVDEVPEANSGEGEGHGSKPVAQAEKEAKQAGVAVGGSPKVSGPQSGKKQ